MDFRGTDFEGVGHINVTRNRVIWCVCVCVCVCVFSMCLCRQLLRIYRMSQDERAKLREGVPYVKLYRYNPKHIYPKLNGYGDNGQRSLKL